MSTEDVLAVRERRRWAQHRRGELSVRQTGSVLDQSHDDLYSSTGVSVKTRKNSIRRILALKTISC